MTVKNKITQCIICICKLFTLSLHKLINNKMETIEKGCVYFFRHIGLSPIKIGYTLNESPIDRFNQFKTYAPFGSEIIGFIQTNEAKQLETKLHSKYLSKRINGEWFEISESDALYEIDFHSKIEDVKNRNEFQQQWANYLKNKKDRVIDEIKLSNENNIKEKFLSAYNSESNINISKTAEKLGVSRRTLYNWINEIKI